VLKVPGQHVLGEDILVEDNKSDAIGSPSHHVLVLVILSQSKPYIQQLVGLLEEGRDSSGFLFYLGEFSSVSHRISIFTNGKIMDRNMAIIELMEQGHK
jgi:hypothetical protein